MKKLITIICLIVAIPFIVGGALWVFTTDAFKAGMDVGRTLLDYLEEL